MVDTNIVAQLISKNIIGLDQKLYRVEENGELHSITLFFILKEDLNKLKQLTKEIEINKIKEKLNNF